MPAAKKKKEDGGEDGEKRDPMHPLLVALYVMLGTFVVVAIICGGLYYYRSRQQLSAPYAISTAASDDDPSSHSWAARYDRIFDNGSNVIINNSTYTVPQIRRQFFTLADAISKFKDTMSYEDIVKMLASMYGTGGENHIRRYTNVYMHVLPQVLEDMQKYPIELEQYRRAYVGLKPALLVYDHQSDALAI